MHHPLPRKNFPVIEAPERLTVRAYYPPEIYPVSATWPGDDRMPGYLFVRVFGRLWVDCAEGFVGVLREFMGDHVMTSPYCVNMKVRVARALGLHLCLNYSLRMNKEGEADD